MNDLQCENQILRMKLEKAQALVLNLSELLDDQVQETEELKDELESLRVRFEEHTGDIP